ncbi:MAG: hypothetical protein ACYSU0_08510 [Planctomycetota bacterium]
MKMPNALTAHGRPPAGRRPGDGLGGRSRVPARLLPLVLLLPAGCLSLGQSDQMLFAAGAALPADRDAEGTGWYVLFGDLYGEPGEGIAYPAGWRVDFASVPVEHATVSTIQGCYVHGWRPSRAKWLALTAQVGLAVHFSGSETGVGPAVGAGVDIFLAEWGVGNMLMVSGRYGKAPIIVEDDFPSWTVDAYLVGLSLTMLVR